MAREKAISQGRIALALFVCVAASYGNAAAQVLQKLTVQSFQLSSDTANPKLEVPFNLIVRVHVRERVASIDNLVLPLLAELESGGDVRQIHTSSTGTDYTETISVVAHHTGKIEIAPAILQAVDARDGRAKQYSSNALTIEVVGGALDPLAGTKRYVKDVLHWLVNAALWTGGIVCIVALVALLFHNRPAKAPAPPVEAAVPAPPHPSPPRSRRDRFSDALTVLRAERNRGAAVRVRAAVWQMIGASDGETLGDVLQRPDAADARMRALLRSLERAAFTYDADLTPAIDDACANLEAMLT